jgi:hypothetical protein
MENSITRRDFLGSTLLASGAALLAGATVFLHISTIGLKTPAHTYQKWAGPQPELVFSRTPYEAAGIDHGQYGFWFGAKFGQKPGIWLIDPRGKNLDQVLT